MNSESAQVKLHTFRRADLPRSENLTQVEKLIKDVDQILNAESVLASIRDAHVFNATSQKIQDVILEDLSKLGFVSEKKGLFADSPVASIRPDYFKSLSGGGIIFEVERGKTIANNMDLLDVWKTHICADARHLFLLVPQIRVSEKGGKQKIYDSVLNRLSVFFKPGLSPIEVDTVTVFGY